MQNYHYDSYGQAFNEVRERVNEQKHERHRKNVVACLLLVHYGVVGYTSLTAGILAWDSAVSQLDFIRKLLGLLAADLVLLASAEGVRHGVYTGAQKGWAKVFYVLAFIDVVLAVTAEGNLGFRIMYLSQILPISGPLMAVFAYLLLANFLETKVWNQKRAADLEFNLQDHMNNIKNMRLRLARSRVDRVEAGNVNTRYATALKAATQKKKDLMGHAVNNGVDAVYKLLELDTATSGDGSVEQGAGLPRVRPARQAKKGWGRGEA